MELNGIKIKPVRNGVKDFQTSRKEQAEWILTGCSGTGSLNAAETNGCTKLAEHH